MSKKLTKEQILEVYLEIQSRLGILVDQAPIPAQNMFKKASTDLVAAKRVWIGDVSELSDVHLAFHGRKVPVALE